jgi:hypothetical protein
MQNKNFTPREAVNYLKEAGAPFSHGTLEVWRCKKRGPNFKRIAGRVFYEKADLDAFLIGTKVKTVDSL